MELRWRALPAGFAKKDRTYLTGHIVDFGHLVADWISSFDFFYLPKISGCWWFGVVNCHLMQLLADVLAFSHEHLTPFSFYWMERHE